MDIITILNTYPDKIELLSIERDECWEKWQHIKNELCMDEAMLALKEKAKDISLKMGEVKIIVEASKAIYIKRQGVIKAHASFKARETSVRNLIEKLNSAKIIAKIGG